LYGLACALVFVLVWLAAPRLSAAGEGPPLQGLPADKLVTMPPLLRHGEVALIESLPSGRLRQVTLIALAAAPVEIARQAVVDVERYPEFVHSMTRSTATRVDADTVDHKWVISLGITSLNGVTRNKYSPDGAIDVVATDPNDKGRFRWEFYPAAGGTVMVMYGYTDVMHSNDLIRSIVNRSPTMEHGLALAAQLVQFRAMKQRAEQLAQSAAAAARSAGEAGSKPASFDFLLDRGRVAVIRSNAAGKLSDFSVLDRIYAARDKIEAIIHAPGDYVRFVEGVKQSAELSREPESVTYSIQTSIPHISWDSRYLMRWDGRGSTDGFCTDGDLRRSQYRWDLTAVNEKTTTAVLRVRQDLGAASLILRTLFQAEPLFEHGIAVALGLVSMAGVRGRAEGWR
jgi:ribosome-associated toxin RatA of RatAB toxin-antitoxin module